MEGKPGKAKIAAFMAAVIAVSGVIAWALYESFRADQNRFGNSDDANYEEDFDQLEPEVSTPETMAEPSDKPADVAKPPAKP